MFVLIENPLQKYEGRFPGLALDGGFQLEYFTILIVSVRYVIVLMIMSHYDNSPHN
jgi:hypothetical protein